MGGSFNNLQPGSPCVSEEETEEETTISIEYTPMELIAFLQLLDYMDLTFLKEGTPMGIIGTHRDRILEKLMKEGVYADVESEREKMRESFEDVMGGTNTKRSSGRNGFQ